MKSANLGLKFALELAAIAALAYWGLTVGSGATTVVAAVGAPLAMIVIWGVFAAPKARRRLGLAARAPLELSVFGLAAVALGAAGQLALAIAFAAVVVANAVLLSVFRQWES
jgi:hypothetical protein